MRGGGGKGDVARQVQVGGEDGMIPVGCFCGGENGCQWQWVAGPVGCFIALRGSRLWDEEVLMT